VNELASLGRAKDSPTLGDDAIVWRSGTSRISQESPNAISAMPAPRPASSPTIVGSAVETIVWSNDAISMTSIRHPNTGPTGWVGASTSAVGAAAVIVRDSSRAPRRSG
jgi:hypothetical protein